MTLEAEADVDDAVVDVSLTLDSTTERIYFLSASSTSGVSS